MFELVLLFTIVLAAGFYMAWNIGANDVANAIGTSVGSGALTLKKAVITAACLEFAGALLFGSSVTSTIQTGIVDPSFYVSTPQVFLFGMLSSLIAAGLWLQIASYFGFPVSTTHTIVGAVLGFGLITQGTEAIFWKKSFMILLGWMVTPLASGILSYLVFTTLRRKILFSSHPVRAAKKYTPFFLFTFLFVITFIVMAKLHIDLSTLEKMGASFALSLILSLIGAFLIGRMKEELTPLQKSSISHSEMVYELDEAKKHLKKIYSQSSGSMNTHLRIIIDEIKALPHALSTPHESSAHHSYRKVEYMFSYLQIISASTMAFAHGANDVANAIGPLAACISILTTGNVPESTTIPLWILAFGGIGIVLGLSTWGYRVIETVGKKITDLTPTRGFSAEFGAATTIMIATAFGLPISTTHTLVGSVVGVGMARGIESLDLNMTRNIVVSWAVTVPAGLILVTIIYEFLTWSFSFL